MKKFLFIVLVVLTGCIPDGVKDQINESVAAGGVLMADEQFKRALGAIELHKLRNGSYPAKLKDLQFLSALDTSMLAFVEYQRLDSGYELNMLMELPTVGTKHANRVQLNYPPVFWKGLGCLKSNAMQPNAK